MRALSRMGLPQRIAQIGYFVGIPQNLTPFVSFVPLSRVVIDMKILYFLGALMFSGCSGAVGHDPNIHSNLNVGSDLNVGYRERSLCLDEMRKNYDSWLKDIDRNNIGDITRLAIALEKKLPVSYLKSIRGLGNTRDRNKLNNATSFASYTLEISVAFELAAKIQYPNCASASSSTFGESVYWELIRNNKMLLNEFSQIGGIDSYYISDVLPTILDFQVNVGRQDMNILKLYFGQLKKVNENALTK